MWSSLSKKTLIFNFLLLLFIDIMPLKTTAAKLSSSPNSHIVSFVSQRKTNDKYAEIHDFDFESFDENSSNKNYFASNGAIEQLFGRLLSPIKHNTTQQKAIKQQGSDDFLTSVENTLENTNNVFDYNENQESSGNQNGTNTEHYRFKQSIPVLEPIKHLLNTVGDGGLNHTTHLNKSRHHLVSPSETAGGPGGEESSAIETEAERDMVYHGTSLKVIDFLGTIGSMLLGFFTNLMKWFTASSGNASASSSAGGIFQ